MEQLNNPCALISIVFIVVCLVSGVVLNIRFIRKHGKNEKTRHIRNSN